VASNKKGNDHMTDPDPWKECERLRRWVNDLQAGMTVNCVYCGHSYGPRTTTPASMADVLKAHVEQCPAHPMSKLRAALVKLVNATSGLAVLEPEWDISAIGSCQVGAWQIKNITEAVEEAKELLK
jgi:hypothetical protein